jgi:hypothetical protein
MPLINYTKANITADKRFAAILPALRVAWLRTLRGLEDRDPPPRPRRLPRLLRRLRVDISSAWEAQLSFWFTSSIVAEPASQAASARARASTNIGAQNRSAEADSNTAGNIKA